MSCIYKDTKLKKKEKKKKLWIGAAIYIQEATPSSWTVSSVANQSLYYLALISKAKLTK